MRCVGFSSKLSRANRVSSSRSWLTRIVSHRLWRCDSKGLGRPVVHPAEEIGDGLHHANLTVCAKGDRHARVAKPVARTMVLQVPRRVRTKISQAHDLWGVAQADRWNSAGDVG